MTLYEYTQFNEPKAGNKLLIILSIVSCQVSAVLLIIRLVSGKILYKRIPGAWLIIFLVLWLLWTGFFVLGISMDYSEAKSNSPDPLEYMLEQKFGLKDILVLYFFFFFPLIINSGLGVVYNRRFDREARAAREFEETLYDIQRKIIDGGRQISYLTEVSGLSRQALIEIIQYLINQGSLQGYYFNTVKEELVNEGKEVVCWVCRNCGASNKELVYPEEKPACQYCGFFKND